jgi:hypothetical protein
MGPTLRSIIMTKVRLLQGYSKGSVGPFRRVHYNAQLEASMQGYSKRCVGPFVKVHYHG